MAFGIDYSFGSGLTAAAMKAAKVTFVCRYLDYLPNGKVINKAEFDNLIHAGLDVVLVWEGTGRDCQRGHAGGQADAHEAERQANALGAPGAIIYFAPCDYDAPPGDQAMIDAYMNGAVSVLGHGRTGMYGGYWPLSRALNAGICAYAWQTYAWSGTNLDRRAHIFQYQNGVHMGPADVDFDHSLKSPDFGQWPRPKAPAPTPPKPAPAPAPPHPAPAPTPTAAGTFRHVLHGTLDDMAARRGTTVEHLWVTTVRSITQGDLAEIGKLPLDGFPVYTTSA
jgi:hypothetical protein